MGQAESTAGELIGGERPPQTSESHPQSCSPLSIPAQLVSIIIPCFNAERWVAETIDSCLAQTWGNREVIAVNDGSSDGSLAVLQRFESRGFVVLDQPNRGASAARNAGFRASRGGFIQFLDADDVLAPDKIERQMALFQARPEAQLVSGEWARFTSLPSAAKFTAESNWKDLSATEFLQLYFETGAMMHPAAWLARRSLFELSGPWDETLSLNDDGEFFARAMVRAGRIQFCQGARSYYRSNLSGSLSGRSDSKSLDSLYRSLELVLGYLKAADGSPRSLAAIAHGWKCLAYEAYPGRPDLAERAEANARALGGSSRPFPGSGRFQLAARFLGWRLAKRLCS
jgi:glycosyltransferase involved in cell wall biosynthesis